MSEMERPDLRSRHSASKPPPPASPTLTTSSQTNTTPTKNQYCISRLIILFVVWKSLLLLIALVSPGNGYDTSTTLILPPSHHNTWLARRLVEKLTRWDAVYFTTIAQRGYAYEQEWAFGWGYTTLLHHATLFLFGEGTNVVDIGLVGFGIAHVSHLLSSLLMVGLTRELFLWDGEQGKGDGVDRLAYLSAAVHILCPAGIFMSAPYAEAPFAVMSMLGMWIYVRAVKARGAAGITFSESALTLLSAVLFGISTWLRGNGLLSGVIFICAAGESSLELALVVGDHGKKGLVGKRAAYAWERLGLIGASGALMGGIAAWPQVLAYRAFCFTEAKRPWCEYWVPSIYSYVQSHYWGVGFLRYWTVSNIPLFLLALPMLIILTISSLWAWRNCPPQALAGITLRDRHSQLTLLRRHSRLTPRHVVLRHFAACQLVLALLALTNYHVQIITRISSGYPIWCWCLASLIIQEEQSQGGKGMKGKIAGGVTRWMLMYSLIQGALFASFLPPA